MSLTNDLSKLRTVLAAGLVIIVSGVLGIVSAESGNIDRESAPAGFHWDPETGRFITADSPEQQRVDWGSAEEVIWDPETRQLVVIPRESSDPASVEGVRAEAEPAPRQPVRWDSLEQIQWDPETRTFITSERASTPAAAQPPRQQVEFDPRNYRLSVRDQVEFQVYDEDLSLTQRIDGSGQIRIPMLGSQVIAGMSVREAEDFIERLYVENRIFRNPNVTIRVNEYAPKEVSIMGAVENPGTQEFPIERNQMDIIEVVSRAGGFTGIARSNAVRVTRILEDGREQIFTVDVEAMITGRHDSPERFHVLPGDVIHVRERFW